MTYQITSRTLRGFSLCCIAALQAGGATGTPTSPASTFPDTVAAPVVAVAEESVRIEVDFIEFDSKEKSVPPQRFAAKSTTLPSAEVEKLLQPLMQGGRAKKLISKPSTLTLGKTVRVNANEPVQRDETNSFGDDAGVAITVGGNRQTFRTRNVGAELELVLASAGPESILIEATLQQTRFEGFVEYGGVSIHVTPTDVGKPTAVSLPRGFYQPIFSSATRQEKLALKPGETAVLHVDWTDCKADEEVLSRLVPPPQLEGHAFRPAQADKASQPMLILVRLRTNPDRLE